VLAFRDRHPALSALRFGTVSRIARIEVVQSEREHEEAGGTNGQSISATFRRNSP
jgi:hypothetical protein